VLDFQVLKKTNACSNSVQAKFFTKR